MRPPFSAAVFLSRFGVEGGLTSAILTLNASGRAKSVNSGLMGTQTKLLRRLKAAAEAALALLAAANSTAMANPKQVELLKEDKGSGAEGIRGLRQVWLQSPWSGGPGAAGRNGGPGGVGGSIRWQDLLVNRTRSGAAQRLLKFYRDREAERSLVQEGSSVKGAEDGELEKGEEWDDSLLHSLASSLLLSLPPPLAS